MTAQPQPKTIDARLTFVHSMGSALNGLLNNECGFKCTQKDHAVSPIEAPAPLALASSLSIMCQQFSGTIILGFCEKAFLQIINHMFGETCTAITPEYKDFAAELLNMTFGRAKSTFNRETSITLQPAIPMVIEGTNMKLSLAKECTNWESIFQGDSGAITCIVSLSPPK